MPLKLTVGREDKIMLSNGIVIDVVSLSNSKTTLAFTAPDDVKIHAIFKDSSKQFKNLRNPKKEEALQPTPEQQREDALNELRRRR